MLTGFSRLLSDAGNSLVGDFLEPAVCELQHVGSGERSEGAHREARGPRQQQDAGDEPGGHPHTRAERAGQKFADRLLAAFAADILGEL